MAATAFMAFLHHAAAFVLFAAIAAEHAFFREQLSHGDARRLARLDMAYGVSAVVLLVVGFVRVFYFEKGAAYYFGNPFFHAKIGLFILVGVLSIYPTVVFASWRKTIAAGAAPIVGAVQAKRIKVLLRLQLAGAVGILFCAAFMAKGVGY